ncbi:MAG: hypothetical protein U5N85_15215 [Arcicella sp.]|nr:hypothetical protein [Arcicella sp.]
MKTKIQNLDDVRAERVRLKNQIENSRISLRQEFAAIKKELNPVNQALGLVSDAFTAPRKGLLSLGIGLGVNTVLKNVILARAGWLPRLVVPFLVKNAATNYIAKNGTSVVEGMLGWVKRATDKKV